MLYHPVSIGSVNLPGNLFLAPVAGYSDRAFRSVCITGGANFTYTEMVSTEALVRGSDKTANLMARAENENQYAIQLFGGNPEIMAAAVEIVLNKKTLPMPPDVIDINAGCPVPKIVKTGAGSALTKDPEHLYRIVKAASNMANHVAQEKKEIPVPITVKIRLGWDSDHITWKEAAASALEAGALAITLHGRTKAQGYEGKANWDALGELTSFVKSKTKGKVPVFGSGDVFSPEAAQKMLQETQCDGIMFARGAMGNPFIFTQTRELLETGKYSNIPPRERITAGLKELKQLIIDCGESSACKQMRKRFCAYSKGLPEGATLRTKIVAAETEADYINLFGDFC